MKKTTTETDGEGAAPKPTCAPGVEVPGEPHPPSTPTSANAASLGLTAIVSGSLGAPGKRATHRAET